VQPVGRADNAARAAPAEGVNPRAAAIAARANIAREQRVRRLREIRRMWRDRNDVGDPLNHNLARPGAQVYDFGLGSEL